MADLWPVIGQPGSHVVRYFLELWSSRWLLVSPRNGNKFYKMVAKSKLPTA